MAIRTSEKNGFVVGSHPVTEKDSLMLITAKGKMVKIAVNDVRIIGRATQGVRLINLDEGDSLVATASVEPEEDTFIDLTPAT